MYLSVLDRPRRQAAIALAAAALLASLLAGAFGAPSAKASQAFYGFCPVTLAPYGTYYDNCASNLQLHYFAVMVYSEDHSACASTTTTGWKDGVNQPWVCTGGAFQSATNYVNANVLTYPMIRNNTTGATNRAGGTAYYNY